MHLTLTVVIFMVCAAGSPGQATRPSITQAVDEFNRETAHLAQVLHSLESHPQLARSAYVRLDLAIARRFLARLQTPGPSAIQAPVWSKVQMQEVQEVLKDVEHLIAAVETGRLPADGLGFVPMPMGGPVRIENGMLITRTTRDGEDQSTDRPFFFGGFGHFGQIFDDLPQFADLGVTLIQDGRHGPAQGLNADGTLTPAAREVKQELDRASRAHVKVDVLTSPHYFPGWAVNAAPDMQNGSAFHNIDHPKQRAVIEAWLTELASLLKGEPALLSYCLSNEPVYSASGRDPYSAPAWHAFLERRHKEIAVLNSLYGTSFKNFNEVPASGWGNDVQGQRWGYDWVSFNNEHFAGWHRWMSGLVKKHDPSLLTHAKIMVFFALDSDKAVWGIDPECFADATDIAGCDSYVQQTVGVGPLDETTSPGYAYHWQVQEMCYDLLNSFHNQPVFNSENHPMPNASGAGRISSVQTRAAIWQGGLHHQAAETTWVWEEPTDPSFLDSIFLRPKNIWAAGRALLDLNRLAEEVAAINRAPARIALLYSPACVYWDAHYGPALRTLYTAVNFMGEKVTFVSERQLAENREPKVEWIIAAGTTHVTDLTRQRLAAFVDRGGHVLLAGEDCLKFDEYHRERPLPPPLEKAAAITISDERKTAEAMWRIVHFPASGAAIRMPEGQPAWGVEYRVVTTPDGWLLPVINLLKESQVVSIHLPDAPAQGMDLLSTQQIPLQGFQLAPMVPYLLHVPRPRH